MEAKIHQQIMRMHERGLNYKEIAKQLNLNPKHVNDIIEEEYDEHTRKFYPTRINKNRLLANEKLDDEMFGGVF